MDDQLIKSGLNEVFRRVFANPALEVSAEMTASDVDGRDSLSHIDLIVAIEKRFDVKFSLGELMTFKNVGDLMRSLRARLP